MTPIDWAAVFDHADRNPPLAAELLSAVSPSISTPLEPTEAEAIRGEGGPDTGGWQFPTRPLPASYLLFLAWSNGGFFLTGDREFQMLAAEELREYLITYRVPYHMPGAVPFALDGGGSFFLFDLRSPADPAGEYPVLFAPAGNLAFDVAVSVARSFPDVCRGRTDPASDLPS
jgi:hypothetical protein